jgi:hypothetical protein
MSPIASPLSRSLSVDCRPIIDATEFLSLMNRIVRALLVVLCFEMGALLLYLPWSVFWEQNFFLTHYPSLMTVVLHPSFRGAISGLGVLDILLALGLIGARSGQPHVPPQ